MGVAGLWDILKPAGTTRSLTNIAIVEGFEANPDGRRGFRLGIDASIWFFHAEYGKEGENPVLRTLFFRCATLMHTTFLPIFVFDGPKRPDIKRGKKINRTSHKLIPGMKQIVEAFGFEWRMAPGEAEAELAYLNRIGIIDGILSDDVDNFLFGATTVIRNSSNTLSGNRANPVLNAAGKDDKNHTRVFRLDDITRHPDIRLTRGGMILIGLMSGGDYQQGGVMRCGTTTAHGLAKCGFGDSLYTAATNLSRDKLVEFLVTWRHELCHELRTNSRGEIGRKQPSLAKSILADFPDIDILLSYVNPITSESMGRESNNLKLTWTKEPDLAKLAATCEFYFEWGYKEAIIKRFRTVIWHSIVLRILRRAVIDSDGAAIVSGTQSTPRKKNREDTEPCGTPSKMIAKYFSSLKLSRSSRGGSSDSDSEVEQEEEKLILKIHSSRTHVSTDGILEYRLEVAPKQLVRLTESGIKGTRVPEGPDEWASEVEDDEKATKKGGKGAPVDPETHLRLWMPACMVKLVEPRLVQDFEGTQEQKELKKMKKGRQGTSAGMTTKITSTVNRNTTHDVLDVFQGGDNTCKRTKKKPSKPPQPVSLAQTEEEESSDFEVPVRLNSAVEDLPPKKPAVLSHPQEKQVPPVKPIRETRDLTKKKPLTTQGTTNLEMKAFFPVTKTSTALKSTKTKLQAVLDRPTVERSAAYTNLELNVASVGIASSTNGKVATCFKASKQSLVNHIESDDSSWEEYNTQMWGKGPHVSSSSKSSPSKRKVRARGTSSTSDSGPVGCNKSPRKRVEHTSPQATRRPVSPSPARFRSSQAITSGEVVEITSDSDSADSLPRRIAFNTLPPLMFAKARAKTKLTSGVASKLSTRKKLVVDAEIIDLT
ncbi:hypothetical protein B0H34DRAFT_799973 [Crassisporium funariophilum]|nr:hypothetical protein B0H34DRAFT_799973 [Crassisporium funariophilum]